MHTLSIKQRNEQAAFVRFVQRLEEEGEWLSVSSRPEPEPDLLCVHATRGPIAFELVSLTDPSIAEIQAAGTKAFQAAFTTLDPSTRIICNKLHKSYKTTADRIDLLIFTDGRIITPDDVIIPSIIPWFDAVPHPFSQVWFMGEFETRSLWNAT